MLKKVNNSIMNGNAWIEFDRSCKLTRRNEIKANPITSINEIKTSTTDKRTNLIMSAFGKIVVKDLRRSSTKVNYRVIKKINNYLNILNQKYYFSYINYCAQRINWGLWIKKIDWYFIM